MSAAENLTNNLPSTVYPVHLNCPTSYINLLVGILVLLAILFLNSTIIFVLVRKVGLVNVGNTLILHLTISDCLLALTAIPYACVSVMVPTPWVKYPALCQMTAFFGRLTHCSSIYLMTVLTACRCYGVCRPLKYRTHIYKTRVNKICLVVWISSFIYALTPFLGWGEYGVFHEQCWCTVDFVKYSYNWFVMCILFYILPMIGNTIIFIGTAKVLLTRKSVIASSKVKKELPGSLSFSGLNREENDYLKGGAHGIFRPKIPASDLPNTTHSRTDSTDLQLTPQLSDDLNAELGKSNFNKQPHKIVIQAEVHAITTKLSTNAAASISISPDEESSWTTKKESNDSVLKSVENCGDVVDVEQSPLHLTSHLHKIPSSYHTSDTESNDQRFPENFHVDEGRKFAAQNTTCLQYKTRSTENNKEVHLEAVDECDKNKVYDGHEKSDQTENKIPEENREKSARKSKKKDLKPLIVVLLIFLSFVIFCSPSFVVRTVYVVDPELVSKSFFAIATKMSVLNSLINPFLFGLVHDKIRKSLRNVLQCLSHRQ